MALAHAPRRAHPRWHVGWHRLVWLVERGAVRWLALASDPPAGASHADDHAASDAAGAMLPAEFERFIREHERPVLNYLWRVTGEEQTAYDLTQEAFLRAWQRFETIRDYDQPRSWLFRVATNLALTQLKRRSLLGGPPRVLDADRDPAASDPARRLAEGDLVRRVLLQLSPQRRGALVLREVYGMSAAEVGHILGISDTAVRMALHRAREQFRELYLREGGRDHGA